LTEISDEFMNAVLAGARNYCLVLLRNGPRRHEPGAGKPVWEHGRRNLSLRADGILAIVCPVVDDTDLCGIGIFDGTPDEVHALMDGDPGVREGVFVYEVHPCRGFPGDSLPHSSPKTDGADRPRRPGRTGSPDRAGRRADRERP
jgi:hypothetical protein